MLNKIILLVEDNPDDEALTLRALKKNHIVNEVVVARDGVAALEYLLERDDATRIRPTVILLDLKLPKLDGLEVLKRLKSDPRTRGIPVVILTSSKEQRDVVESYHLGVNSYIVKPVDSEGFSKAVGNLGFYWLLLNQRPPEHVDVPR